MGWTLVLKAVELGPLFLWRTVGDVFHVIEESVAKGKLNPKETSEVQ